MEVKSELYHMLLVVLSQVEKWLDKRHLKTLAWMVVGLIESEQIGLTRWIPYAEVRAQMAQSVQRRFQRWLENERIDVNSLYGPLIQAALREWGDDRALLGAGHLNALGEILYHSGFHCLSGSGDSVGLAGDRTWQ